MIRFGWPARAACTAALIVAPVARPSSTRIRTRPASSSGGRSAAIAPLTPQPVRPVPARRPLRAPGRDRPASVRLAHDAHAAGCDGAHGIFLLPRKAQLAHHQHVERRAERLRHFPGHRHAAARQRQHQDVGLPAPGSQRLGERTAGVASILEFHRLLRSPGFRNDTPHSCRSSSCAQGPARNSGALPSLTITEPMYLPIEQVVDAREGIQVPALPLHEVAREQREHRVARRAHVLRSLASMLASARSSAPARQPWGGTQPRRRTASAGRCPGSGCRPGRRPAAVHGVRWRRRCRCSARPARCRPAGCASGPRSRAARRVRSRRAWSRPAFWKVARPPTLVRGHDLVAGPGLEQRPPSSSAARQPRLGADLDAVVDAPAAARN